MGIAFSVGRMAFDAAGNAIVQPSCIYSYERMIADLNALMRAYPGKLSAASVGRSQENRDILVAVVGPPNAPCQVLIQGSIHAREHVTTLLMMAQIERLLRCGPPRDTCFHMLPMTNPDGVTISQRQQGSELVNTIYLDDVASGNVKLDRACALRFWKANAVGVDLNRNFDAGWERVHTRPAPSGEGYRGPWPQSEPETKALVWYTKKRPLAATISYHASGSEIYYEFGDNSEVNEASCSLALAVNKCLCYKLLPDSGVSFGGYKDWAIEKMGIPSLTIEVGLGSAPLDVSEFSRIWRENKNVPYAVADWIRRSGFRSLKAPNCD